MTIPEITKLLEEKRFDEAESALNELERADRRNTSVAYLFGTLYQNYDNPSRSRDKAKKYFSAAATGSPPVEGAFVALARLESHSSHVIRVIEKGLMLFPNNETLHLQLFRHSALENRETVFLRAETQGLASDDMRAEMVSGFIVLSQFEKAIKLADEIKKPSLLEVRDLLKAICLFELEQTEKAREIFKRIVGDDLDHKFTYVPHFGLIACQGDAQHKATSELLSEIPSEIVWSSSEFVYWPFDFDYSSFVHRIIGMLEKSPACKNFLPKLRGLRGLLINAAPNLYAEPRNRTRMLRDLEYAHRHMSQNALVCKALHEDRATNRNYFEAYELAVTYFGCAADTNSDDYGLDLDYLRTIAAEDFSKIVESFKSRLPSERYGICRQGGVFDAIVQRLSHEKKYELVAELAEIAGDYYAEKTGVLFQIAYSFAEVRKREKARKYYKLCLQKNGKDKAVLNNLSLLEQHDGRLDQAEALLRQCIEADPEYELPKSNLKRVLRLKDIVQRFQRDDLTTRKLIFELWRRKGSGYELECSPSDIQGILTTASADEAKTRLRQIIEKGYLEQKNEHNVFELSAGLRSQMSDLERTIEKEGELAKLASEISKENLERIGFDDELINALTKVGSIQLQTLLKRDLKEAALARLTNSHKTALVMCGSVIEAVLTDRILGKSIRKHQLENGKSVSVFRMDLGDLLYVAIEEKLIDDQIYHLAHALRGFRNLIHPGVEQRKTAIAASESNARIAWDITRKLLSEM